MSVDIEDASLSEILREIASRAGINLLFEGSRHERVSAHFDSVPLDEAFQRLIMDNFLLLYSSGADEVVAEVWVGGARMLSSASSSRESRVQESRGEAVESQTRTAGGLGDPEDRRNPTHSSAIPGMDSLLQELREGDAQQRRQAVWALGDFQDDNARDAVTTALKGDADAEVRRRAVWLLDSWGGQNAMSALVEAVLGDPDESVRQRAVESLAKVGGQEAVEALSLALRDPSPSVRYKVLTSLTGIGADGARASLLRALRDPDELVRDKAAELLATPTQDHQ